MCFHAIPTQTQRTEREQKGNKNAQTDNEQSLIKYESFYMPNNEQSLVKYESFYMPNNDWL